jgi:hypothetical protein
MISWPAAASLQRWPVRGIPVPYGTIFLILTLLYGIVFVPYGMKK